MGDPKPNTTDTISELGQSAYANVLSEQAALILLYQELMEKLKSTEKVDVYKKQYYNFSTDRSGQVGQFHISKELTKTTEMKLFFHQAGSALLSYLIPSIKLYKTIYNIGDKAKPGKDAFANYKLYDWRIPFDTTPFKSDAVGSEILSEILGEEGSLTNQESGRLHGVGIKSLNYEYVGTNPAEVNTNIKVSINFYFQNISDLVKDIKITKDDPRLSETPEKNFTNNSFRYSDLVNNSARTKTDEWTKSLVLNEFYYRIKAVVGYAPVGKETIEKILTEASYEKYINLLVSSAGPNIKDDNNAYRQKVSKENTFDKYVEKFIRAIESARVVMFLTPYSHVLNFNEDGTLEMQVEYHATIDKVLNSESADVMKISNAYIDYITKKEQLDILLDAKKARINQLQNQGCDEKLINEAIQKEFSEQAKGYALKSRYDSFLTSRYNLYSSLYENIVGLDTFRSKGESALYAAKINSDFLAVNKEGEWTSFGENDPEGKALKYSAFARLNALASQKRVEEVKSISKEDYKEDDLQRELAFLGRTADNLDGVENLLYAPNPEEQKPAAGNIQDPALLAIVQNKTVLIIHDLNSRLSKVGEKIINTLTKNGATIIESSDFINDAISTVTFGSNNFLGGSKFDFVISFAGMIDAQIVEDPEENKKVFNTTLGFGGEPSKYKNFSSVWAVKYIGFLNGVLKQDGKMIEPKDGIYLDSTDYAKNNFYAILPPISPKEPDASQYPITAYQDNARKPFDISKASNDKKTYNQRLSFYHQSMISTLKTLAIRSNATKYLAFLNQASGHKGSYVQDIIEVAKKAGWNFNFEKKNNVLVGDYFSGVSGLYPQGIGSIPEWQISNGSSILVTLRDSNLNNLDNHIIIASPNQVDTSRPIPIINDKEANRIHDELMLKIKLNNALDKKTREELIIRFNENLKVTKEKEEKILKEEAEKAAKLDVKTGFANVKFVMLGNVLDTALKCLRIINPREVVPRIILGNINLKVPKTYIKDTNSVVVDLNVNLADIPISIDLFQKFLLNKMVKPQRSTYTAMNFIKDVISDLIVPSVSPSLLGEDAYLNNNIRFSTFGITVPADQNGLDPIFKIPHSQINTTLYPLFNNKLLKDLIELNAKTVVTSDIKKTVDYLFIYCSSQFPTNISGDIYKDEENKVFHFRIGTDSGIVKKIKFSASDNRFYREAVAAQEGNLKTPLIRQTYDAEVTMFGNNIFRPGDFIYIEPIFGYTNLEVDLQDKVGLGGYYQVINVRTSINENIFETSLKCTFFAHKKANGAAEEAGKKICSLQGTTPVPPTPEKTPSSP